MDGGLAAIGDIATGSALARSVEPEAGEAARGGGIRCLNCGTFLIGEHCHSCGQNAHVHRHVGAFGHDFLHSILHFEGKLWRTLPLLTWRPGELTRRYIEGERAQFISPLALFLFTVFLTFAVFNAVGVGGPDMEFNAEEEAAAESGLRSASARVEQDIAGIERSIAAARAAGRPTAELEADLRGRRAAAQVLGLGNDAVADTDRERFTLIGDIETGIPFIDEGIAHANENPSLSLYKLQSNSYKYSWLLILISAPFLWLLYPFSRRFGWYDHLVFVTYSISFMALMWVVLRLLSFTMTDAGPLLALGMLYAPFHMYRQLRGAYRSSRIGALLRTAILQIAAFTTILGFMLALMALEVIG
jgi:hypothetical protein